MGAFDDLIPAPPKIIGAFDDLVPLRPGQGLTDEELTRLMGHAPYIPADETSDVGPNPPEWIVRGLLPNEPLPTPTTKQQGLENIGSMAIQQALNPLNLALGGGLAGIARLGKIGSLAAKVLGLGVLDKIASGGAGEMTAPGVSEGQRIEGAGRVFGGVAPVAIGLGYRLGSRISPEVANARWAPRSHEPGYLDYINNIVIPQQKAREQAKVNTPLSSTATYSPTDLARYKELSQKLASFPDEQVNGPEWVKTFQEQQAIKNKYGGVMPTELSKQPITKGAQNAVSKPSTSGILPHAQSGVGKEGSQRSGVGQSVKGKEASQAQGQRLATESKAPTPSGPLSEKGLREEGRGSPRPNGGEGDARLSRVGEAGFVGTGGEMGQLRGDVRYGGEKRPVQRRTTPELLKDLGVNPFFGKNKNQNVPFRKLNEYQLADKYKQAKTVAEQAKVKEHPDRFPGLSKEELAKKSRRYAEIQSIWAEIQRRITPEGKLISNVERREDKGSVQQSNKTGEAGFVINLPQAFLDKVQEAVKNGADDLKTWLDESGGPLAREFMNRLAGNALPRTTAVNKDVSAKLYNYAQANAVSDVLAQVDPNLVLGTKDPMFDRLLGGTLVEYNLRATGNTSIGKPWSPFKTEQDYQNALNNPAVKDAIQRHADIVLKDAEQRHLALGGSEYKLPDKRMFVNLKFLPQPDISGKLKGGNLKATLQGKTRFGMERKGTAEAYETSYKALSSRMIRANYAEYQRKLLNEEYAKQGLGEIVGPGEAIPQGHVEIPVKLQRAVLLKEGESPSVVNQSKSLYIRKDLAPEYLQAMQANSPLSQGALRKLTDILAKVQVSLGVDAVQHTVNMLSSVDGVVRAQIGRNLIGAREVDTVARITKNVADILTKDPKAQAFLKEMAKTYGIAREPHTYEGVFGHKSWGGAWVRLVDQAGRMTLTQIAKELGDAGLMTKDPVEVRNFVNKHLGQYNARLIPTWQALAKVTFSPFIVAGKTFNRLAASRLILSPQVKAANPQAWATMRARQALYLGSALVIVPAVLNYYWNGNAFPEDTRIGEIKMPNGKILDVARFMLIRRGERITGAQAVIDQQLMPRLRGEQPASWGQTGAQAFTDIARGVAAPYAGPLPNIVAAGLTGKTALGYQAAQANERYPYYMAAIRQANPLLGAGLTDHPRTGVEQREQSILGLRDSKPRTIIGNLRRQFLWKIGKAKDAEYPPSEYTPMFESLQRGDVATAKAQYETLLQEKIQQHQNDKDPEWEAKMDFQKAVERYAKSHGNSSDADEKAFVKTLTPHQRDLYDKAQAEQEQVEQLFLKEIQGKLPKKSKVAHFGW